MTRPKFATPEEYQEFYGSMWEDEMNRDRLAELPEEERKVEQESHQMEVKKDKSALAKFKAYAADEEIKKRFGTLLGDRNGQIYLESVIIAVSGSKSLQKCSAISLMRSALRAASLGLSVDPIMQQAHLVNYKDEATLIPDYHGLVQMSVNTGWYEIAPDVEEVYEGQVIVKADWGGRLSVEGEKVSDKVIGWRGYFKSKDGIEKFLYMTNEECFKHAETYNPAGYKNPYSAWNKNPVDRLKMCRKTVLRTLVKRWGNFSPRFKELLVSDEAVIEGEMFDLPEPKDIVEPEEVVKTHEERLASIAENLEVLYPTVKPTDQIKTGEK